MPFAPISAIFRALPPCLFALALAWASPASAQSPAPTADNPWVTLAPLPEAATGLAGAAVNGKLYLFGGIEANSRPKGLVLEFDPATGAWIKKKPMPLPAHHAAVATYGDKVYLFGGYKYPDSGPGGWQPLDAAWEYDPANDTWKTLKPMPGKRGSASAAVADGKFYVIGGAGIAKDSKDNAIDSKKRHDVLATVDEYDPKTNAWRPRTAMPTARNLAAAATVTGKIYVTGGRIGSAFAATGSDTDIVEAYDPAADTWSIPLARMPTPRAAAGFALWRNQLVVLGTDTGNPGAPAGARAVETYDPGKNAWKTMPPMPAARRGFATGVIGDRLYVAGGDAPPAPGGKPESKPETAAVEALQLDVLK